MGVPGRVHVRNLLIFAKRIVWYKKNVIFGFINVIWNKYR